jgi:hypothetical protein
VNLLARTSCIDVVSLEKDREEKPAGSAAGDLQLAARRGSVLNISGLANRAGPPGAPEGGLEFESMVSGIQGDLSGDGFPDECLNAMP